MLAHERGDQLVEIAVHDLFELVQRQVDPVIGHPALREVVRADPLGAVARADQALARGCLLRVLLVILLVLDPRGEHLQRAILVLVLRAVVLALDDDSRRDVRDAHRRIGLVDVLAARARRAERVDPQIGRIDLDFADLVGLGHHRDRARGRMDAALRLGRGHALHAVAARFELQARVRAVARDPHDHFLVAAEIRRALRHHLDLPALPLRVAQVHPQQVAREQRRFVAARARADFDEDVALVVRVLRQQHRLQLGREAAHPVARAAQLVLGEIAHRGVGEQFLRGEFVGARLAPLRVVLDDGADLRVLARQLAILVEVRGDVLAAQQVVQFGQPGCELVELALHARLHGAERCSQGRIRKGEGEAGRRAPLTVRRVRRAGRVLVEAAHQVDQRIAIGAVRAVERARRAVNQLVGERLRQRIEHGVRIVAAREHLARALDFRAAQRVRLRMHVTDHGHDAACVEPLHEILHARLDDRLGLRDGRLPRRIAFAHDRAEIVDGIEEHVLQLADFGLDVARHREVDHEDRPVAARLHRALDGAETDDRQRRCRARHDDVELVHARGQIGERHRAAAEALGELRAALGGAVRDDELARALRGEVGRAELDHLARADEQHALLRDLLEDALREAHGRGRHRHRLRADLGRAAHFLRDRERALEQLVQVGAERTRLGRGAYRVLHLAEDLRFAEHHRIEPGRDAKRVAHRLGLRQRVHVRRELVGGNPVVVGHPADRGVARGAIVGRAIQFSAIAGRQDRRFGCVRRRMAEEDALERRQCGLDLFERKRHAFAQGDRRSVVVDSDREELHVQEAIV
ncbi:hypothetical protein BURPS1710b_3601 [Burkholderia pseudomallei 1710b]|uniref:Uncharacterized protein n=1 Tax=Burkholderia pseudomallei (strain 1710b) TaxID=320372 RepID=Q3JN87_BURP1|nr:hypothetical protein BURPS1710b_3601 [Burkholderia pseudomallei 1710b]